MGIVIRIAADTYQVPFFGEQRGWRVAWAIVGSVSVFAAILCASFYPSDQKEKRPPASIFSLVCEELGVIGEFLRIKTFWIIILQDIFKENADQDDAKKSSFLTWQYKTTVS